MSEDCTDCSDDTDSISTEEELEKYHPLEGKRGSKHNFKNDVFFEEYQQVFHRDCKKEKLRTIEDPKDAEIAYLKYLLTYEISRKPITIDETKYSYFRNKKNKMLMNELADIKESYSNVMKFVEKMEESKQSIIKSCVTDTLKLNCQVTELKTSLVEKDNSIQSLKDEILGLNIIIQNLRIIAKKSVPSVEGKNNVNSLTERKINSRNASMEGSSGTQANMNITVDECEIYIDKNTNSINNHVECLSANEDSFFSTFKPLGNNPSIQNWCLFFKLRSSNAIIGGTCHPSL